MASGAAQRFFNSQSPEDQEAIRASWGGADLMDEWYKNAKAAGDPGATAAASGGTVTQATAASPTQSQSLGGIALPAGASGYNAADPTAYRRIDPNIVRNMTPEQRAEWSAQNIDDLSAHGDAARARAQWLEWQKHYDPNCPPSDPYQAEDGSGCVEKPDNSNKGYASGEGGDGGDGGGGGGGGGGGPVAPPAPQTFGSQLSYTGNPLTDMLLYQFNTGTQLSDPSKMNTFALGEDRQEGGEGANADQQKRTGQLLKGGGLWWSGDETAFSGFRADQANAAAAPAAAAPAPAPQQGGGGGGGQQAAAPPVAQSQPIAPQPTPMVGMLDDAFNKPRRKRDESGKYDPYGGGGPMNAQIQAF